MARTISVPAQPVHCIRPAIRSKLAKMRQERNAVSPYVTMPLVFEGVPEADMQGRADAFLAKMR